MITMTGAEFKRFYAEPLIWTDDVSWDDTLILVSGSNSDDNDIDLATVDDGAKIEIDNGYLINPPAGVPEDLQDAITWWREKQTTTDLLIRVPNEKLEAVREALKLLGIEMTGDSLHAEVSRAAPDSSELPRP